MSDTESIELIVELCIDGEYDEALRLANEYISRFPTELAGYREKGDILQRMKNYDECLITREKRVDMGTTEPRDFYSLSKEAVVVGRNEDAVRWATWGVELCRQRDCVYFLGACYFNMAVALVGMARYEEALEACSCLKEGWRGWFTGKGLVTREDLKAICNFELARREKGEGRREKGEGRREKGEGRREKGEGFIVV